MGKSDKLDHSGVRERVTDANKVPLGRPTYFSGSKPGSKSLLKPSYLMSSDYDSPPPSSSSSSSSSMSIGGGSGGISSTPSFTSSFNLSSFSGIGSHGHGSHGHGHNHSSPQQHQQHHHPNMPNLMTSNSMSSLTSNYGSSHSNSNNNNSKVMAADYSRWSEPQGGGGGSQYYSGYPGANNISSSLVSKSTFKRENDDSNDSFGNGGEGNDDREGRDRKRKRRSRWMGSSDEKAVIPGMPTILPSDLPPDQQEAYIAQLQIEELTRKLRSGDLGIPPNPEDRSPSPEPIYGTDGKRLNTREYRTRKKLEEERHKLIQRLLKLNPDYKPPADYRAPIIKIVDRVPIPQEENPEINFVGLLIGPRGNTLKGLEKDTGAKIIIRGKGSVKEGKVGGKAGHPLPGEDEPLHAYVTSNNPDSVKKACEKIKDIIRQGIDMPESQNDLRKNQLRELALLNGTLREGEGPKCSNCGATSHRTWHCPDKPNVTNSVICTVCGGAGHIARDCRFKRPGAGGPPVVNFNEKAKIDEEYMSLMAELGEAPPKSEETTIRIPRNRPHGGGHNLFEKASAPKAIAAPPPPSSNDRDRDRDHHSGPPRGGPPGPPQMSGGNMQPPNGPPPMMQPPPPQMGGIAPPPPPVPSFPPPGWNPLNQPPPPGDLGKNSGPPHGGHSQPPPPMLPPPPPNSWGYPPGYPPMGSPPMGGGGQWGGHWGGPPPPVPPPPGGQPPPPGMYWQQQGNYGMNPPPPPPPDQSQPPPPPPS